MQLPKQDNTFFSIVEKLDSFLQAHEQVNGIFCGTDENVDLEEIDPKELPFVFYGFGQASFDEGTAAIDIELIVAEIVLELPDPTNRKFEVMTAQYQTLSILRDCISLLKNHDAFDSGNKGFMPRTDLTLPVNATPFTAKYKEHLVGWMATVTLTMDNENNLCLVPLSVD